MVSKKEEKQSAQIIDAGLGELNKVRDILFGREMSNVDSRFSEMEQVIEKKMDLMSDRLNAHLAELEKTFASKVTQINTDLTKETEHRQSQIGDVESQLRETIESSEKVLTQAINASEDAAQQDMLELRSHIDKQQQESNKQFADNMDQLRNDLTKMFQKQADELDDSKLGREALALLLDEVTVRLRRPNS